MAREGSLSSWRGYWRPNTQRQQQWREGRGPGLQQELRRQGLGRFATAGVAGMRASDGIAGSGGVASEKRIKGLTLVQQGWQRWQPLETAQPPVEARAATVEVERTTPRGRVRLRDMRVRLEQQVQQWWRTRRMVQQQ